MTLIEITRRAKRNSPGALWRTLDSHTKASIKFILGHGMEQMVYKGLITDRRAVDALRSLPDDAVRCICRVETRLGRKLTRARMKQLADTFLSVVSAKTVIAEASELAAA